MKVVEGKFFTSIHELPCHNNDILMLNNKQRQVDESEQFNQLQNSNTYNKVYLIDSMFIKEWIAFTNKNPEFIFGPPGVIDNAKLEQVLVIDERFDELK